MQQIGMFPLTREELHKRSKEQAALELEHERLSEEKDRVSGEYTERLKKMRQQIRRLAKEIDREQAEREASDEEAPWQPVLDQAQKVAGRARRRRDRTGELVETEPS